MREPPVVIVGAGHAGFTVADTLRARGYDDPVVLVDAAPDIPYQRPPLSKAYLSGQLTDADLAFRPEAYFAERDIELVLGDRVDAVEHSDHRVMLSSGRSLRYGRLVLATGSQPRRWPEPCPEGVHYLHRRADSSALGEALANARSLVVIGAGFIGLEVASHASALGLDTTVVDVADRVLARSVSPPVSRYMLDVHRAAGTTVRLGETVTGLVVEDGRVRGVRLEPDEALPADVVVIGIGSEAAGPWGTGGIQVDAGLRSTFPDVYAAGDVAVFPRGGRQIRLESVQNATDHARCVVSTLLGGSAEYDALPWFWTEQLGNRVQIAGLAGDADTHVVRGDMDGGRFTVLSYRGGELVGVESVNATADHLAARTLLARRAGLSPRAAADPSIDLRQLAKATKDKE
jgi:3-phenylpropionate/trans-cinnamate dioxygenase ferredoxin reductase subunit